MKLVGEEVKHSVFGKGIIVEQEETYVNVKFVNNDSIKKFQFPSAFGSYIETLNEKIQDAIVLAQKEYEKKELEKNEIRRGLDSIKEKEQKILKEIEIKYESKKKPSRHNVIIKLNYCDECNFDGNVACKRRKSYECYTKNMDIDLRVSKGFLGKSSLDLKYNLSKNIQPGSLIIFATKLPNSFEKDLFIHGGFIVAESGKSQAGDGYYIYPRDDSKFFYNSNSKIKLNLWDCFTNPKSDKKQFGSGFYRYISDEQGEQILEKMIEFAEIKEEKDKLSSIYTKFRNTNRIIKHVKKRD